MSFRAQRSGAFPCPRAPGPRRTRLRTAADLLVVPLLILGATLLATEPSLAGKPLQKEEIHALLHQLRSGPEGLRNRVVQRLYHLQDERANAALVQLAAEGSPETRALGLWALGIVRPHTAAQTIRLALDDVDASVRRAAVGAAGQMRLQGAARKFRLMLRTDPDASVHDAIVKASSRLGRQGVHVLRWVLAHGSIYMEILTIDAMDSMKVPAARRLLRATARRGPAKVRLLAALALVSRQDALGGAILRRLASVGTDKGVRLQALRSLVRCPSRSARYTLRRALKDQDADIRRAAADALAELGDKT